MRALLLGGLAAVSFLAAPADAAVNCFGPSTGAVCVETPGVVTGSRTECYYLGGTQCTNVKIPTVSTSGGAHVFCRGDNLRCEIL